MGSSVQSNTARREELQGLFLRSLPDIQGIVRFVARRHRLSEAEEDDFHSEVKVALIESDYEILARFRGISSLRTYLTTVIHRLFLDRRRKEWGTWRPSAVARRRGPLAVQLEALIYKEGLSLDEAIEKLHSASTNPPPRQELRELAYLLPPRATRKSAGEDSLSSLAAPELSNPEAALEIATTVQRTQSAITDLMSSLSSQDRLVLQLRFEDQLPLSDVARILRLDQRNLYRRVEAILAGFRKSMESRGLNWSEVQRMIDRGHCHLLIPRPSGKTEGVRTSLEKGRA